MDRYVIGILSIADYSPFGVELDGRSMRSEGYRYGYNFHEKDDEISGNGNHISWGDYGMSPRLGRHFNLDPQGYRIPDQSPHSSNNNNPIKYTDSNGEFGVVGALLGAAVGAAVGVVKAAINGEDFTDWKTIEKIGNSALTRFVIGGIPVSGAGLVMASATSNLVDQGIEKKFDGKNFLDLETYDYKKAGWDGLIEMLTFGIGSYTAKYLRNQSLLKNWDEPLNRSWITKLFYNRPTLGANLVGGIYDISKSIIEKGVKKNNLEKVDIELPEITITPPLKKRGNVKPEDEKKVHLHIEENLKIEEK